MRILQVFLYLLVGITAALAQDPKATMLEIAQQIAKGMTAGKLAAAIDFAHPRILKQLGGREAALTTVKATLKEMEDQGVTFSQSTLGQPGELQKIGTWLVCAIPQTVVLKIPRGTATQEGTLIGISEDEGKHWFFLDAAAPKSEIFKFFPELKGKFDYPDRPQPTVKVTNAP